MAEEQEQQQAAEAQAQAEAETPVETEAETKAQGKAKGENKQNGKAEAVLPTPAPRLRQFYVNTVAPKLKQDFDLDNPMALPKLAKIVLNVGLGKELQGTKIDPKAKEQVLKDLTLISGQKPIMLRAKKSVANFKVRAGYESAAMVTMRGARMWEFLDRLITLAIPRIKDFRGLKTTSFDGRGSYSFGINEQGIFPEIDMANANYTHGMNITLVFQNSTDELSRAALTEMGFPFQKPEDN